MDNRKLTLEQVPDFLVTLSEDITFIKNNLRPATIEEIEQPLNVEEAKAFLNLENPQTVYRMVREGRIPHHKKGSRLFFYKSELNQWIKGQLKA